MLIRGGLLASRFDFDSRPVAPAADLDAGPRRRNLGRSRRPGDWLALSLSAVEAEFRDRSADALGGRRSNPVLESIDLSISLGECVALVGESGAGNDASADRRGFAFTDSGTVSRLDHDPSQVIYPGCRVVLSPGFLGEQIGERLRAVEMDAAARSLAARTLDLVDLDPKLMQRLPAELSSAANASSASSPSGHRAAEAAALRCSRSVRSMCPWRPRP